MIERGIDVCGASLRVELHAESADVVDEAIGPRAADPPPASDAVLSVRVPSTGAPPPSGIRVRDVRVRHAARGEATVVWTGPSRIDVSFHDRPSAHILRRLLVIGLLDPLALRGLHLIHGASVAFDDRVVLLVGASGAGKSTISRALASLGGASLTENYTLVDARFGWRAFLDPFPLAPAVARRYYGRPIDTLVELVPTPAASEPLTLDGECLSDPAEHYITRQFRGALSALDASELGQLGSIQARFTASLSGESAIRTVFSHETSDPVDTARAIRAAILARPARSYDRRRREQSRERPLPDASTPSVIW